MNRNITLKYLKRYKAKNKHFIKTLELAVNKAKMMDKRKEKIEARCEFYLALEALQFLIEEEQDQLDTVEVIQSLNQEKMLPINKRKRKQ